MEMQKIFYLDFADFVSFSSEIREPVFNEPISLTPANMLTSSEIHRLTTSIPKCRSVTLHTCTSLREPRYQSRLCQT
jgi:hypothetical protein